MVVVVVVASNKEEVAEYVLQHSIEYIYIEAQRNSFWWYL